MRVETHDSLEGVSIGEGHDADTYAVTITTKSGGVLRLTVDRDGFWELREGTIRDPLVPIKTKGRL